MEVKTTGRNSVLVVQRSDGGAMNFMNASLSYGQFGTGNGYPVRILANSAWRMSLNLDNSLTMANGASCTSGGVWTNASSRELKENIEDLSVAEAEKALRELAPVKHGYKADQDERHVGFIAEDVPDLVASKDRKTMSPMDVVAPDWPLRTGPKLPNMTATTVASHAIPLRTYGEYALGMSKRR